MHYGPWSQRYGMVSGLPAPFGGPPPVHGLGNWPMVRPHCSSNQVKSHSHRVPVKTEASMRLSVRSPIPGRLAESPRCHFSMVSFGNGKVRIPLSARVRLGPALARDSRTGPVSLNILTKLSLDWLT